MQSFVKQIVRKIKQTNYARVIVFTLFLIWCGSFVVGFTWALFTSLNEENWLYLHPVALPKKLYFINYIKVFSSLDANGSGFLGMVWNSLWLTFGGELISMSTFLMAGYALGNFQFKGRKLIVSAIVILLMIPLYGTSSATLMWYMDLQIYNTPWMLITNTGCLSGTTLIVMTFSKAYRLLMKKLLNWMVQDIGRYF